MMVEESYGRPSNLDSTDPDLFDGNPGTPLMYVVFVATTMLFTGISAVLFPLGIPANLFQTVQK